MSDSATPWSVACQAPLSVEFSKPEYWSGLFSHSVVSDFLRPHGLQHARLTVLHHLPELAQTWWCHPAILSSVIPFLIFPSIRVFSMSQLFMWGGQSIGASASVLPMNIQGSVSLELTGLLSLQSRGCWRVLFITTGVQEHQFFNRSLLYGPALTCLHDYWKNDSFN